MGKNDLILSSSPRKGSNSDLLCDRFLMGAQEGAFAVLTSLSISTLVGSINRKTLLLLSGLAYIPDFICASTTCRLTLA